MLHLLVGYRVTTLRRGAHLLFQLQVGNYRIKTMVRSCSSNPNIVLRIVRNHLRYLFLYFFDVFVLFSYCKSTCCVYKGERMDVRKHCRRRSKRRKKRFYTNINCAKFTHTNQRHSCWSGIYRILFDTNKKGKGIYVPSASPLVYNFLWGCHLAWLVCACHSPRNCVE